MNRAVISARISEFLTGSEISAHTGACCWPCARPIEESPRSPCTNPPSQLVYWVVSGLFRCICFSSFCTAAGVAPRPSTTLAAFPGRTEVPMKISTAATSSDTAAPSRRRPTKARTGETSRSAARGSATVVIGSLRGEPGVHEQIVAEHPGRMRFQALDLGGEPVHPVGVGPVDVPALVVLDLLHLVPCLLGRGLVGLADRLEQ